MALKQMCVGANHICSGDRKLLWPCCRWIRCRVITGLALGILVVYHLPSDLQVSNLTRKKMASLCVLRLN